MDSEKVSILSEHRVLLRGKAGVWDQQGLKVQCEEENTDDQSDRKQMIIVSTTFLTTGFLSLSVGEKASLPASPL